MLDKKRPQKAKSSKPLKGPTMIKMIVYFDRNDQKPKTIRTKVPVRKAHADPMYLAPLFD